MPQWISRLIKLLFHAFPAPRPSKFMQKCAINIMMSHATFKVICQGIRQYLQNFQHGFGLNVPRGPKEKTRIMWQYPPHPLCCHCALLAGDTHLQKTFIHEVSWCARVWLLSCQLLSTLQALDCTHSFGQPMGHPP